VPWRPLKVRNNPDQTAEWEGPHEGIPDWLYPSINRWVTNYFFVRTSPYGTRLFNSQKMAQLERQLHLKLTWDHDSAAIGIIVGALADDQVGPEILDWCVAHLDRATGRSLAELEVIFSEAGSVWTVAPDEGGGFELQRRVDATVRQAVTTSAPTGSRYEHHLAAAWSRVYRQNPDPSSGYREAVRAVEAAAQPVVSPADPTATLGKMIADMTAKPSKWRIVLQPSGGIDGVSQVIEMMRLLWKSQLDRHGTATNTVPLSVSLPEAQAAVHLAASLVQLFSSGAVYLT
jgi:hypothetical protein